MDWRNIRCCLCWFICLAAINFLVALLIAYRTLSGECEPEVCYEHGTCLTNKDGYKCQCHHGYTGDQCQFKEHLPLEILHRNLTNSNHTKYMVISTPSAHAQEVERQSLRDPGLTSAYWTFIVVYSIASTSIFLLAFFILNFFQKNMSKQYKGKDYYGIQFKPEGQTEEEIQNQRRHLVSDASGLDIVA